MSEISDTLFVITARGGSKGIPKKNSKLLAGKPLICYSIDIARQLAIDADICVSTDSNEIMEIVTQYGLKVPFIRPSELAQDTSGSQEVLIHCLDFYKSIGKNYTKLVLLQPTSPFRTIQQTREAIALFDNTLDMVVSVKESDTNPYYNLFEPDACGLLIKSKTGYYTRRQDCPVVYQYNGAIYVINTNSIYRTPMSQFKKVKGFMMDELTSLDIDNPLDWNWAEFLIENNLVLIKNL
ncbi:MAG: acylneuraminate cytidylyltransferase family protein [Bacteroidota bacterium]|nr:acylneuraminate cytidylyltransferase family protein [Bacteroidota bacterium]